MRYAVITRHRGEFDMRLMRRVLSVSPAGYYASLHRPPSHSGSGGWTRHRLRRFPVPMARTCHSGRLTAGRSDFSATAS